ncbi:MAG: stage 0 sporulation family protein [Oscillospiraceae bacterium]|nr:stage 0 sporulation family protein [Oscillospiraceae bacterium]MCL2279791.1 stage 0 sporulation family protein [Oscillospiraceae bacterium]
MTQIVSIKFNEFGKAYFFDPSNLEISKGDMVVVETAKGLEYGECVQGVHEVDDENIVKPLRPVVRVATEEDRNIAAKCKEKEKEAFEYCREKIVDFGLEMKLVNVEFGFEGSKILFFFTSDGRVDFRELVKDLAARFRVRIELRQIGVRDEAKMLGGLGVCGKQFCCSQFLTEFHPVSIKMAKTQGLSLNPTKISGACGRLMCCLKYEEVAYKDLVKKAPKVGAFVETPFGKGSVINVNILRGNAKIRMEDGFDTTLKTCTFDELDILGGKGRRAEYITARDEGRLEEAGFKASPPPQRARAAEPYNMDTLNDKPAPQRSASGGHERKDHKNHHRHKANVKGEHKRRSEDMDDISTHPEPLEGAKHKKPHYKRRKKRKKPGDDT